MGGGALARIRLTSTSRPQWRDTGSPQPNKPEVKRNRLGRKSWKRSREGKSNEPNRGRKSEENTRYIPPLVTHLLKLFHGKHLLCELEF